MNLYLCLLGLCVLPLFSCFSNTKNHDISDRTNTFEDVTLIYNNSGQLIERFGNEKTFDNDVNFRFFYMYDSIGNLTSEKRYFFDDENIDCVIKDFLDFDSIQYNYDFKGVLISDYRYFPVYDKIGNVIKHELGFAYDYIHENEILLQRNN